MQIVLSCYKTNQCHLYETAPFAWSSERLQPSMQKSSQPVKINVNNVVWRMGIPRGRRGIKSFRLTRVQLFHRTLRLHDGPIPKISKVLVMSCPPMKKSCSAASTSKGVTLITALRYYSSPSPRDKGLL